MGAIFSGDLTKVARQLLTTRIYNEAHPSEPQFLNHALEAAHPPQVKAEWDEVALRIILHGTSPTEKILQICERAIIACAKACDTPPLRVALIHDLFEYRISTLKTASGVDSVVKVLFHSMQFFVVGYIDLAAIDLKTTGVLSLRDWKEFSPPSARRISPPNAKKEVFVLDWLFDSNGEFSARAYQLMAQNMDYSDDQKLSSVSPNLDIPGVIRALTDPDNAVRQSALYLLWGHINTFKDGQLGRANRLVEADIETLDEMITTASHSKMTFHAEYPRYQRIKKVQARLHEEAMERLRAFEKQYPEDVLGVEKEDVLELLDKQKTIYRAMRDTVEAYRQFYQRYHELSALFPELEEPFENHPLDAEVARRIERKMFPHPDEMVDHNKFLPYFAHISASHSLEGIYTGAFKKEVRLLQEKLDEEKRQKKENRRAKSKSPPSFSKLQKSPPKSSPPSPSYLEVARSTPSPQLEASPKSEDLIKQLHRCRQVPEIHYTTRVHEWFDDPQIPLQTRSEYAHISDPHKMHEITFFHAFPKEVDQFLPTLYCAEGRWQGRQGECRMFCLPAKVSYRGTSYQGSFVYTLDGDKCYHRCFQKQTKDQLVDRLMQGNIWYGIDFPTLEAANRSPSPPDREKQEVCGETSACEITKTAEGMFILTGSDFEITLFHSPSFAHTQKRRA
ncbi:MAG: hypothetical protein S4CHLAM102_03400 [Chlamydiia bacterium]|nr:hypothetical protein [Chlamydiia bacterium]